MGGEKNLRIFLFNDDTSGKYTSALPWQCTMYCSGQSCQKHLNCNERAAFVIELKQFAACTTSGPYILRKNIFPKEFDQSQLSVPSLKAYLGPSKNIYRVEKRCSFSGKISIHKNTHWRPLCLVVGRGHGSEQHLAVLPRLKEMLPLPMSQLG